MAEGPTDDIWTPLKVLRWTQQRFAERGLRTPRLDAEVLLAHVLGVDRVKLYTSHDQPLAKEELAAYRESIRRRLAGEAVAYLVGRQEFWSLPLKVDARVLIPRPETELLVEVALEALKGRPAPLVGDIGTGSGAVAIAIAHERPDARVLAVDRSPDALAVARENVRAIDVDVACLEGDLTAPLRPHAPFDVLVSNPPYIPETDFATLPPEVQREPREALLAGADGLDVLRRLARDAPPLLVAGGALACEIGAGQADAVAALWREAGLVDVSARKDLAGIERVVIGRRPG